MNNYNKGRTSYSDDTPGGALAEDETLERVDVHAAAHTALDRREARVEPAYNQVYKEKGPSLFRLCQWKLTIDEFLLDEPGQLSFAEDSVHEVHLPEAVDVNTTKTESVLQPVELLVAVVVLCRPQCVGHPLDTIDNRTGEVVSGVRLVLRPGPMVRSAIVAVQHLQQYIDSLFVRFKKRLINRVAHGSVD